MKAWLWGLLWRLLVSALIAVMVLLAMFLLSACAKPAPLSPPIATPTTVVPDKGIIGPEVGPSVMRRLQGVTSRDEAPGPLAGLSELPWRGLVVYDLNEPAFDAGAMATKAARIFLGCEVWAWIAVMGNMPKDAVGYAAGERGGPQIHPSWRQKMAGMGLDLEIEQDRWTFALWLAKISGWQNWAYCQHMVKGADGTSYGGY